MSSTEERLAEIAAIARLYHDAQVEAHGIPDTDAQRSGEHASNIYAQKLAVYTTALLAELRATREQRDKALDQRMGLVDVLTQKARGYKERAEAAEAERDGAIRLNDTYQQDCTDLAAQVAALTAENRAALNPEWEQSVRTMTDLEELRELVIGFASGHYAHRQRAVKKFLGEGKPPERECPRCAGYGGHWGEDSSEVADDAPYLACPYCGGNGVLVPYWLLSHTCGELATAEAREAALRAALGLYADESNWHWVARYGDAPDHAYERAYRDGSLVGGYLDGQEALAATTPAPAAPPTSTQES